ncbi:MAG: DUF4287 domain-containing protein [Patescibacteria group bacterium]
MSFDAYITNIQDKTGKTPKDFVQLSKENGLANKLNLKAKDIIDWLKKDFDLGHGHSMAIVSIFKKEGILKNQTKIKLNQSIPTTKTSKIGVKYNANPPFTNEKADDFFDFISNQQKNAIKMRNLLLKKGFQEGLKYNIPFYFYESKPVIYLHYLKPTKGQSKGNYSLEISFINGDKLFDNHRMFQTKNSSTKAILIPPTIDQRFLDQLEDYFEQAISIAGVEW